MTLEASQELIPDFLPKTRDWVSYIDNVDGAFYQLREYTDGNFSVFQQDDLLGGELLTIRQIPSTFVAFTLLVPTLSPSNNVGFYWFDEVGNFIMNPHADNGRTINVIEVFLEERPYGELQNITVANQPIANVAGATYQFQTNPVTGLTNHLFSFTGPFSPGAGPGEVRATAPSPAGPQDGGPNPPRDIVQTFAIEG